MNFEWDENKNQANIKKHGVDFRDACYVFADQFALNRPDDEHLDNISEACHQKRTKYIQQKKGLE